jgi:hypothetical protein
VLNLRVKSFKILTSTLIHGGENFTWTIRILLESLQHVLKMYTWYLSENQASIQFRCRLVGILLKQSLLREHDFHVLVYRLYHYHQNVCLWHLNLFPKYRNGSHVHIREEHTLRNQPDINSMVVEKPPYFHLMNFFHIHQLTCMSSSISFVMVSEKKTEPECCS